MTPDLFDHLASAAPEPVAPGAILLRAFALVEGSNLLPALHGLLALSPLRHLVTPGGQTMSVAMSNCGPLGWVSDRNGYRYVAVDPISGLPWPAIPAEWTSLAKRAAASAGFAGFEPDACLINEYQPGARLSLHQDRDERDLSAPIVSVSLGLPAVFLFGSTSRSGKPGRYRLNHGDVVVWGGPSRLAFHGVSPLAEGDHPLLGRRRINLTFRRAG